MGQTTVGQTDLERPAQPATAPTIKEISANTPTREEANAAVPTREVGVATTPPLSSGAGEEIRTPPPTQVEEPPVEARAPEGVPDLGKRPMTSSAMVPRAPRARRPRRAPTTKWRRSRGVPMMGANIFMSGVSVGTTGLATRRSPKSKRRREWNGPPSGLSTKLR